MYLHLRFFRSYFLLNFLHSSQLNWIIVEKKPNRFSIDPVKRVNISKYRSLYVINQWNRANFVLSAHTNFKNLSDIYNIWLYIYAYIFAFAWKLFVAKLFMLNGLCNLQEILLKLHVSNDDMHFSHTHTHTLKFRVFRVVIIIFLLFRRSEYIEKY